MRLGRELLWKVSRCTVNGDTKEAVIDTANSYPGNDAELACEYLTGPDGKEYDVAVKHDADEDWYWYE